MKTLPLGKIGLTVSQLCLGTMTWGSHNTESEGHAQADLAVDQGVTFWDTAEMYPTNPVKVETVGRTEEIIGSWLASCSPCRRATAIAEFEIAISPCK